MFVKCSTQEDVMRHPSCKRASTVRHSQDECTKPSKNAEGRNGEAASPDHHTLPFGGMLRAIFGREKVERLSAAVHFSFGDANFRRVGGKHPQMMRVGLLLVLLFLQSLFIAIDYLPVTLEILSRDRGCAGTPMQESKPAEQSR